ncbi:TetR family transcriptional regulator C-terminal domain-containing protein [Agrobacterium sp. ES01]|uniref:TetR family transcriptional regulator C-terminal domain-containing protein n=1 Tax=Agrobacterium sp. ES01 TaxID=3420714 RepID=UPI003D0E588D
MDEVSAERMEEPPVAPRKASREARRLQLIEATIDTLATEGYSRTTLTNVAARAGLSHGLVIFHFQSKEGLLTETLLYLAEEYRQNWRRAVAAAGESPAAQLSALIGADFLPEICNPVRLSAWCAFWGEAQSRPIYQQKCGSNDLDYIHALEDICARLVETGGYAGDASRIARILRVTIEGVWLDLMIMNTPFDRQDGLKTVFTCAAAFFPAHFTEDGLAKPEG